MVGRFVDLLVLALVAVAVLMPRPDVKVSPALRISADRLERVAELEAQLAADPGDASTALELGDHFLDGHRPDWALATVTGALARSPHDHRLHGRRSLALAEHFEAAHAYQAVEKALALCDGGSSVACTPAERTRLELLHGTLARVKDIDMRKDPNTARARILRGLRPAYLPPDRKKQQQQQQQQKAAVPAEPPPGAK